MIIKGLLLFSLVFAFCRVNAQEGVSIYIEPPGKDTIIDEVMINGKLINGTGKRIEYFNFYGTCKENDTFWRIWIRKDSMELFKNILISRGFAPTGILEKDSVYRFQFCINVNNLYSPKYKNTYQKDGEYVVWIKYYFGDMDLISNKIKLYLKSSLKNK